MAKKLKVLHLPENVGGNPFEVSIAERKLGLESFCLTLKRTLYNYPDDLCLYSPNRFKYLIRILYWGFFASKNFDVLHFNFGSSLFPMRPEVVTGGIFKKLLKSIYYSFFDFRDIKIAKRRKKVIAVTYQGDDARQGDYCRKNFKIHFAHEVDKSYYTHESDDLKRNRILKFSQYADLIYALNPDLLHILPRNAKFLPYACINLKNWAYIGTQQGKDFIPRVVHAPTHRQVKGSNYIIEAVKKLKEEGIVFDFTLVEGKTHAEAKKIYEGADLLIDQLLAGFYGGLSVEFMALGKPVICYLRAEDMSFLPVGMRDSLPIINSEPKDIYNILKKCLIDKHELYSLGIKSREYVENWHDPSVVATILKSDYEASIEKNKK